MPLAIRTVLTLAATLAASPLVAQGRGRQTPPTTPPATQQQTQQQVTKPGLDFQNQQVVTVIQALAEAGGVNISLNGPTLNATTSLRMGPAPSKAEVIAMIKTIAEANNIKISGNEQMLMVLTMPPRPVILTQQQITFSRDSAYAEANKQSLHTYQLRHSTASSLAPVLTALFAAQGGRGGGGVAPQTNTGANAGRGGAAQNATQQRGQAAGAGAGGRGGGGGGGRGGVEELSALSADLVDQGWELTPSLVAALTALPVEQQDRIISAMTAQGAAGPVTFTQAQGAQANPLQALTQLFGGGGNQANQQAISPRIIADQVSNTLMILASDADWLKIQEVLKSIDLRPLQVLIEVTIAEVTRSAGLNVGLQGRAAHKSGLQSDTIKLGNIAANASRDLIFSMVGSKGAVDYNLALNALQTRGNVKVLAMPMIIAQNNLQAVMNVGQSIPFANASVTSTVNGVTSTQNTYNLVDVGTVLTITPTISPDEYVNMVVNQTDDNATPDLASGQYIISRRVATTTVLLKDGQTTVIGGLAGKTISKTSSGIPILSSIPIIGPILFGNKQDTEVTTELFVFLTPHIISSDEDIDRLRRAVEGSTELLKDIPTGTRFKADSNMVKPDTTAKPPVAGGRGGGGQR